MRVLQINGVIHQGSTGAIVDAISDYTKLCGDECVIAYGIGSKLNDGFKFCYRYEQALYRRCSMITGYRYGFAPFSTRRVMKFIDVYKPDIVHLHSINGNCVNIYSLLGYLKKKKLTTVITNHAEFFYTGNCTSTYGCEKYVKSCRKCHSTKWASGGAFFPKTEAAWKKMKQAFTNFENLHIVCVSGYSHSCSKISPILGNYDHSIILNGINTNIFKISRDIDIRQKYDLSAKRIAVFVTSEFSMEKEHLKGGYWLVELAKMYSSEDFQFLVVGSKGQAVQQKNIKFVGQIRDKHLLANIYTQADIVLGFSKSESFGMTCTEALCCGTPFVGFKCGGTESIALEEFTKFADYGDLNAIVKGIKEMVKKLEGRESYISDISQRKYSSELMAKRYHDLYERLVAIKNRGEHL